MTSVFSMMGPAPALLLLAALLAAGARADQSEHVTTAECEASQGWRRVRQYPTDSNATSLWMAGCGLTEINPDTFTGLPNLVDIELQGNNIENINAAVFLAVPALKKLFLDSNKLREPPVFEQHSCPNLIWLDLSSNQLTGIHNAGTFSACAKLKMLYLHNNHIDFIHFKVFSPLTELRSLLLNGNKIRFIPDQLLDRNGKLEVLHLQYNRITYLPPDFASSRKRAGAGLREFYFPNNPWHCACLLELLADVKRAGARYEGWPVGFYDGARPECNYISMREYPCRKIRELNFIAHGVR